MRKWNRMGWMAVLLLALAALYRVGGVHAAGGPAESASGPYKVLAPIESGNLLLFPVVRVSGKSPATTPFLTLDEGIRSGDVEVTEAGRVRGLVRPRGRVGVPPYRDGWNSDRQSGDYGGDQVNTLVLVNHSGKPLLLLAGEIVTGGKQDRVIAKDRIVPAGADPIDLGVFCIEPGRWTETSPVFGSSAKGTAHSFMVQPQVREKAMAARDQQQVWDSVRGSIAQLNAVAVPAIVGRAVQSDGDSGATTSYARTMESSAVSAKVDEAAAPVVQAREKVLAQLQAEHAVGVVLAVRGEIVWADIFANTDLLTRYWTKLVRSYAAESLTTRGARDVPTVAGAQRFLNEPTRGAESSEGDVSVYLYRDLRSDNTETFILESQLPDTGYNVHISKMKLRQTGWHAKLHPVYRPDTFHPLLDKPAAYWTHIDQWQK